MLYNQIKEINIYEELVKSPQPILCIIKFWGVGCTQNIPAPLLYTPKKVLKVLSASVFDFSVKII